MPKKKRKKVKLPIKGTGPAIGSGGEWTGPPVLGPGQGTLPGPFSTEENIPTASGYISQAALFNPGYAPYATGATGTGPSPGSNVGPFEQTWADFQNIAQYGTTAPYWSQAQMGGMYGATGLTALFNQNQAANSIMNAELGRMYGNLNTGIDHYAGQILPWTMQAMNRFMGRGAPRAPKAPAPDF